MESGYESIVGYAAALKYEIKQNYEAAVRDPRMQKAFMDVAYLERIKLDGLYELVERVYHVSEAQFDDDMEDEIKELERVA